MDALRNVFEEGFRELLVCGEFLEIDGNKDFLGLCIDITDIDTTFVCEQNPVALSSKLAKLSEWKYRESSRLELS